MIGLCVGSMAEESDDGEIMFGAHEPQPPPVEAEAAAEQLDGSVEWLDPELRRLSMEADQVKLPYGFGSPLLDDDRPRADASGGGAPAMGAEPETAAPPSAPKSWASLVSTRQASAAQPPEPAVQESSVQAAEGDAAAPAVPDPAPEGESLVLRQRKAWLAECAEGSLRYQPPPKPRGLVNNGNTCFMNVILQCLVACQVCAQLPQRRALCVRTSLSAVTNLAQYHSPSFSSSRSWALGSAPVRLATRRPRQSSSCRTFRGTTRKLSNLWRREMRCHQWSWRGSSPRTCCETAWSSFTTGKAWALMALWASSRSASAFGP